ncbi:MAG: PfaD family polyunsaturated fatty acid/polyketide biosynthesis protein [Alicyclobacillus sp.]|nr:PfaD family polyunsaturated fatty acid/polyketide biosynthesis protein [Alicyclobacillus sp.]
MKAVSAVDIFQPSYLKFAVEQIREPLHIVVNQSTNTMAVVTSSDWEAHVGQSGRGPLAWMATVPPCHPEWLGDASFLETHRLRFPYLAGEMANGIATSRMVIAMANAGMMGFFGAGGLSVETVERAVQEMRAELGSSGRPWGVNLIHSPYDPALEAALVDLYLRSGVSRISASAFLRLTPAVVRFACAGLRRTSDGRVVRPHHVFAKISRAEVARQFLSPAPPEMLGELVRLGQLTAEEAELAAGLPVAEDITVEADSGGHTDGRPLLVLLPEILRLRDEICERFHYVRPVRVGAAGGIGTPQSAAAAFAAGAAYVLTGSINQCAVESGASDAVKAMLAQATATDVATAPAADMFELGAKVQVLKRGTLFASRATQLYELYRSYGGLTDIPSQVRSRLEREIFRTPLDEIWASTRSFFALRDASQVQKAESDSKHKMALVFRWYLGNASKWAIRGQRDRQMDYQIWCGPAMGAFNEWVQGSFLEDVQRRSVVQMALNLLEGAAVATRAQQLRSAGVRMPSSVFAFRPRPL